MEKKFAILIAVGIVALFLLIFSFFAFQIVTVKGTQMGVLETWSGGVSDEPYSAKTYFLFPSWTQEVYIYDIDTQVFDVKESEHYTVASADNQDMKVSLSVRWRRDPAKIVNLHKTYPKNIVERLIEPEVKFFVQRQATKRKAIDAFSGDGLVKLQSDILEDLTNPQMALRDSGVIVETFVIKIGLDEAYIGEIRGRQVATQRKLRADEETKAAEAVALRAQAEAKADFNKRVVEAERDKQVGILAAEQDQQKQILAAEAEAKKVELAAEAAKKQVVLAAEGEKEAGVLRAQAIQAIGKAEADANKMKFDAYTSPGSEVFARIEVAKSLGNAYGNIKGYLPSNMNVTLLTDNFQQTIENLLKPKVVK